MNLHVAVFVAAIVAGATSLEWPTIVTAHNLNRYGKQQLPQKQNRYGNPAWLSGASRAGSWATSPYGGNIMRHYPVSINRYQTMAGGGGQRQNVFLDDYYDADALNPYDSRPYNRMDYAVIRYPSYSGGTSGYYAPVAATTDLSSPYDAASPSEDDLLYDDVAAAVPPSSPYSYQAPTINRYSLPAPPPFNRYEQSRYPTDKIHKFRKVFLSNPVSPSNAFKSTKEQQLYDFWESLINGDLDGTEQRSDDRDRANDDESQPRRDWLQQLQQSTRLESETTSATSTLYQHLPTIFQQLQQKQRQQQQQQQVLQRQQSPNEQTPLISSSSSSPSSSSMSIPRGNLYKQWANGSPLIKRSSATKAIPLMSSSPSNDSDDVRQLEKLKPDHADVIVVTNVTAPAIITMAHSMTNTVTRLPMADRGQREYVLPRPAGEKSGLESLLEVIAAGGTRENKNEIAAATYKKVSILHYH